MSDRNLSRRLRELPRETAGPDFTRRVMARLEGETRAGAEGWGWRPTLAIAGAVLAFALVPIAAWQIDARATRAADAAELQALRAEYAQIQDTLSELTRVRGAGERVVYLGGDDTLDVVFDPTEAVSLSSPASYQVPSGGERR